MFYGASKPSVPAYQLTNVLTYDASTSSWNEEPTELYEPRELLGLMSVRYEVEDDINVVRDEMKEEFQSFVNPIFQPVNPESRVIEAASSVMALQSPLIAAVDSLLPKKEEDTNIIKSLVLDCLSTERANDHDKPLQSKESLYPR